MIRKTEKALFLMFGIWVYLTVIMGPLKEFKDIKQHEWNWSFEDHLIVMGELKLDHPEGKQKWGFKSSIF